MKLSFDANGICSILKRRVPRMFQLTAGMTYRFFNVPLVDSQCRKQGLCADMDLNSCAADVSGMVSTAQSLKTPTNYSQFQCCMTTPHISC